MPTHREHRACKCGIAVCKVRVAAVAVARGCEVVCASRSAFFVDCAERCNEPSRKHRRLSLMYSTRPPTRPPARSRASVPVNGSSRPHAQVVFGRDAQTTHGACAVEVEHARRKRWSKPQAPAHTAAAKSRMGHHGTPCGGRAGSARSHAHNHTRAQLEPPSLNRC